MAVRIDDPRDEGPALAVEPEVHGLGSLVASREEILYAPIVADQHRVEANDLVVLVQRVAVDVVDERVGGRCLGQEKGRKYGQKRSAERRVGKGCVSKYRSWWWAYQ